MNPLLLIPIWEAAWWGRRRAKRASVFQNAQARARILGRPLVVIGAPDHAVTGGYPCGDLTLDIEASSSCPNFEQVDITDKIPLADDSAVVFVSCTLEYVNDYDAAMKELLRVSGGELYIVRVEPWTLASVLYPGAKRTLPAAAPDGRYLLSPA